MLVSKLQKRQLEEQQVALSHCGLIKKAADSSSDRFHEKRLKSRGSA